MDRNMRRASEREGRRLQALPWNDLRDTTAAAIERQELLHPGIPLPYDAVWRNNHYVVMITNNLSVLGLPARRLFIRRCDAGPVHSWYDFQRIKNAIAGPEATAIEVYPPESRLTDVANVYWLWILDDTKETT
jgi:hypothetical protein